ncbi:MAG: signal peptidase I [Pyrobaculum sp.]
MRGWVKDLAWLLAILIALVAYSSATGVAWPIAVVSSYSMEPTLRLGDFILLMSASCNSIQPGEIIVYVARHPLWAGSWIIHRVYKKEGCSIYTWGDNNNMPDQAAGEPPVVNNVVGKVAVVVPYVGVFPLVVRPQGVGLEAVATWLGRMAVFFLLTYGFYHYFKQPDRRKKGLKKFNIGRKSPV